MISSEEPGGFLFLNLPWESIHERMFNTTGQIRFVLQNLIWPSSINHLVKKAYLVQCVCVCVCVCVFVCVLTCEKQRRGLFYYFSLCRHDWSDWSWALSLRSKINMKILKGFLSTHWYWKMPWESTHWFWKKKRQMYYLHFPTKYVISL